MEQDGGKSFSLSKCGSEMMGGGARGLPTHLVWESGRPSTCVMGSALWALRGNNRGLGHARSARGGQARVDKVLECDDRAPRHTELGKAVDPRTTGRGKTHVGGDLRRRDG